VKKLSRHIHGIIIFIQISSIVHPVENLLKKVPNRLMAPMLGQDIRRIF